MRSLRSGTLIEQPRSPILKLSIAKVRFGCAVSLKLSTLF